MYGRLFDNRRFSVCSPTAQIDESYAADNFANDYLEGLIGIELERKIDAKTIMLLRSSGMTSRDYKKYKCMNYDQL